MQKPRRVTDDPLFPSPSEVALTALLWEQIVEQHLQLASVNVDIVYYLGTLLTIGARMATGCTVRPLSGHGVGLMCGEVAEEESCAVVVD